MKRYVAVVVVAVVLATSTACAVRSQVETSVELLAGVYAVSGTNPDKATYEGLEARVSAAADGSANIEILIEDKLAAIGIGLRAGNSFSFVFQSPQGIGFAIFTIQGKTLVGQWKFPGIEGIGTEVWERKADKSATPPASHQSAQPARQRPARPAQPGVRL